MLWWCACLAVLAASAQGSEAETSRESGSETAAPRSFRLPGDVYPEHYDLTFAYDIDADHDFPYFGLADIKVIAKESTDKITLHAKGLTVAEDQVKVTGEEGDVGVAGVTYDSALEWVTLRLATWLRAGAAYSVRVPHSGHVRADLDGVYVSSYLNNHTKQKEYLIASQFEAIAARKAFPCFDEPMYKATFRLTLGHHRDYTAISNMPLDNSLHNPMESVWPWDTMNRKFKSSLSSWVWSQFLVSRRMSSYLVALVIGRLARNDSPSPASSASSASAVSRVAFSTWARPAAIAQTEYAAEVGPKVLAYYEEFFNISYPLPKMDQVALPDFAAGAMENWGLVTYRETALLTESGAALSDRARVAEVVAHELAHQWFGNLVTMQWWSELWLNEGFATYMSTHGVSAVEPTWRVRELEAADNVRAVWRLDALRSSHPVAVELSDPRRIAEIFDDISYRKGAALVRMMMTLLGEKVFRAGLHSYLLKHSYGNANQESLWEELTRAQEAERDASGDVTDGVTDDVPEDETSPSVRAVMHSWSTQAGYPLLTARRDYRDGTVNLTQRRYLSGGGGAGRRGGCHDDASEAERSGCHGDDDDQSTWWVPLGLLVEPQGPGAGAGAGGARGTGAGAAARWLAAGAGREDAPRRVRLAASCRGWLLLNADLVGPYRVNYDARNWQLLGRALQGPGRAAVPVASRAQLVADSLELASGGYLPYKLALQITNYLRHETDYIPLAAGFEALGRIHNLLQRTAEFGAFSRFVRALVAPAFARSGLASAAHTDLLAEKTQVLAARWACRVELPACAALAETLFEAWRREPEPDATSPVGAALRGTVVCAGVRRGGGGAWRWALQRAGGAARAQERGSLRAALSCTRDPWLLAQYLEWCVTNNTEVRRQDAAGVMAAIASSSTGHYVARDFLYSRLDDISHALKGRSLGVVIRSIVTGFIEQRELDQFLSWREEHKALLEDAKMTIDQAVEVATNNIEWSLKYRKTFIEEIRALSE